MHLGRIWAHTLKVNFPEFRNPTTITDHAVGLQIKQRTITHREPEMNVNVRVSCDVINERNLIGNYTPVTLLHYRYKFCIFDKQRRFLETKQKGKIQYGRHKRSQVIRNWLYLMHRQQY